MRTKHFILTLFVIVVTLSSCVIREPEDKTRLTEAGWSMYSIVEPDVSEQTQLFDKILFMDTYLNTPDSLKKHYLFDNFGQYSLTVKGADCIFKMDNDTNCVIKTDSKSIHSVGAEWMAKGQYLPYYMTVQCISKNRWRFNIYGISSYYNIYMDNENLDIQCTDTLAPKRFRDSDFSVSGDAVWKDNSRYDSEVTLNYTITSPLKYIRGKHVFSAGTITITAVDSTRNKKAETVAKYIDDGSDKVEIAFNGLTSTYANLQWIVY